MRRRNSWSPRQRDPTDRRSHPRFSLLIPFWGSAAAFSEWRVIRPERGHLYEVPTSRSSGLLLDSRKSDSLSV